MTLIAIKAHDDHAEFITDTLSWTPGMRHLGRCTKYALLSHLDGAILTQGDTQFGADAKTAAMLAGNQASSLDDLRAGLTRALRRLWAPHAQQPAVEPSLVLVVGYSAARERFTLTQYASDDDFAAVDLDGLFVHPSPVGIRPSAVELDRAIAHAGLSAEDAATWQARPEGPAPTSLEEWARLAVVARQERALDLNPRLKVPVAGTVFHTRLERSAAFTQAIYEFDDTGEELQRLVAGTLHPLGQLGACPCGSGQRLLDCCLVKDFDEPCDCGSGTALSECCALPAQRTTPVGCEAGLR